MIRGRRAMGEDREVRKYCSRLRPFSAVLGYNIYSVDRESLGEALGLCLRLGITFRDSRLVGERALFCVPFFSAKQLEGEAKKSGFEIVLLASRGIPPLIVRHRFRLGLPVGIILSLVLIFLSSGVIWDVRVEGTQRVREEDVEEVLAECGLYVGSKKSSLNVGAIENAALILSDEISWISVNVIGTVAKVEIRELDIAPEDDEPDAANIVASENGKILGFEDIKGNIAVHIGDAVSRGQLLIGGIYGDEENDFRYTAAKGRVLAEVERELVQEIPRAYAKKVYTGRQKCEKTLVFFKKEIKFFSNCGNLYPSYDKIEEIEYLRAPNGNDLPVAICTVRYLEYEYKDVTRTDAELVSLAKYRLDAALSQSLADGELLGFIDEEWISEDKIVMRRTVRSIENIAKIQEIEINIGGLPSKNKE